jgi:proline iminopeptidase
MLDAKLAPNLPQWQLDHVARYQSSGGTDGHIYHVTVPDVGEMDVPSLLLVTTGRKSGEKFLFPLFYGEEGNSYIIVASKGGAPDHPGWYKNLLANPVCEIQVGTKVLTVRARTVTGAARAALWEKALKFWPPYAAYQLKVPEREIPVVLLDPV